MRVDFTVEYKASAHGAIPLQTGPGEPRQFFWTPASTGVTKPSSSQIRKIPKLKTLFFKITPLSIFNQTTSSMGLIVKYHMW